MNARPSVTSQCFTIKTAKPRIMQETLYDSVNLQGPLHAFQIWSRNGWVRLASFCQLPTFSHWETLPALLLGHYITDSWQTLACV